MQAFRNLTTASKIIGLVVLMAIFLGIVGYAGFYSSNNLASSMDDMYKDRLLGIKWLNGARAQSRTVESLTIELFINQDKAKEQNILQETKERAVEVDQLLSDYSKTKLDPYEQERLLKMMDELKAYRTQRAKAIELALAGKQQEAYLYFVNNAAKNIDTVNVLMKELADYNSKVSEEEKVKSEALVSFTNKLMAGITLVAIVLSLGIGWFIARMIANPLALLVGMAQEVSQGNLAVKRIDVDSKDEIGQLAKEFQVMTENLGGLVKNVAQTAEQVAASSEELTASAEQSAQATNQVAISISEVAQGAEKQVNAVGETSAVIEQMSAGIQQVAANANNMAGISDKTADAAKDGSKAVETAINQMINIEKTVTNSAEVVSKLGERSKEIGQIVDTISGIAGQTNLLALNAAIEAARAGEQGRGFAVVADEVRKLAEQSHDAAKQIANLIREIQGETDKAVVAMGDGTREVKLGAEVVNTAGRAFGEIVKLINQVSEQATDITAAIQQMASGSQQIVTSVREVDKIGKNIASQTQTVSAATEEQSASMEEIASSSESLSQMAQELQRAVSKFRV